jgi:hypothetical protein
MTVMRIAGDAKREKAAATGIVTIKNAAAKRDWKAAGNALIFPVARGISIARKSPKGSLSGVFGLSGKPASMIICPRSF